MKKIFFWLIFVAWGMPPFTAVAGEADVLDVVVKHQQNGGYRFDVTVAHQDEGWNHYVDKWEIVAPGGTVLGTRVLHHPHEEEQPFTRSLSGVQIPGEVKTVTVRAHDSVHEFGGVEKTVPIPE